MTVENTGQKFSYAGDGTTTGFPFPRPFIQASDLRVILVDPSGTETVQSLAADCTVATGLDAISGGWATSTSYSTDDVVANDGAYFICIAAHTSAASTEPGAGANWQTVWLQAPVANGGEVEMAAPPAPGETLVVTRDTEATQETSYFSGGAFSARGHELALDKITLRLQDIDEKVARAPRLKESTVSSAPVFPEPDAAKVVGWNAAGTGLENQSFADGTITAADVKSLYESNLDTNAFTDADESKLDGLGAGANVAGPASAADGNLATYDGATGKLIQDSGVAMADVARTDVAEVFADDLTVQGSFTSVGIDDNASGERVDIGDSIVRLGDSNSTSQYVLCRGRSAEDSLLTISGGNDAGGGANIQLFGENHSNNSDFLFRSTAGNILRYDHSASQWEFQGLSVVDVGNFESAGIVDNAASREIRVSNNTIEFGGGGNPILITEANTAVLGISGGASSGNGGNIFVYGGSHASEAGDILLRTGTTTVLRYDHSDARWECGVNFLPDNDDTRDLGSASVAWRDVYGVNAYTETSDRRLKEEITVCDLGLEFLQELKPKKFKWKSGRRYHYGLLAQDVKDVLERRKINSGIFVQSNPEDPASKMGLRTGQLVPTIVQAIQELVAGFEVRFNEIEARLAALESIQNSSEGRLL